MTYSYKWLHLETGKTGTKTMEFTSRLEFLEAINRWNHDDRWRYWADIRGG